MSGYYYLVSYDYNIKNSEILSGQGYCILLKDKKISQNKYPSLVIEEIIDHIKTDIIDSIKTALQEAHSELYSLVKKDDIKVVLRNLQLIE